MVCKVDGTNGLIQSYDYQTPTTGFSYTFTPSSTGTVLVMNPAGTLATGTITMPASPADGMTITFSSSQQITALTMAGNGASINNAVTFLPAKTAVTYVYRATGTTWWPMQSVPGTGSQLVSATAQNSTSGTSIDFTSIPSWVKRITVMFSGVSTSGTSNPIIQIGSGSVSTSGYVSASGRTNSANNAAMATSTAGFIILNSAASDAIRGAVTLFLLTSNTWVANGVLTDSASLMSMTVGGTSPALSGTLDRVRITTVNGTDQFDAGSINILYE